MPWQKEPKKDGVTQPKSTACRLRLTRRSPNEETLWVMNPELCHKTIRHTFNKALRKRGVTGETLLQLLETRLDNVAFRLGFATTRPFARQMVVHGHLKVNGRKVSSPSFNVKTGDVVEARSSAKAKTLIQKNLEATQMVTVPDWLVMDKENLRGEVKRIPTREEIAPIVNERLVVELYSR